MGRITLDKPLIKELSELLNDNNLSEIIEFYLHEGQINNLTLQ